MKDLIFDLSKFLRTASYKREETFRGKVNLSFKLFLLDFFSSLVLGIVFVVLIPYKESVNPLTNHATYDYSYQLFLLIKLVVLVPIIEEACYRLHLKFSPLNLALSFSLVLYFILSLLTQTAYYSTQGNSVYIIGVCFLASVFLYFLLRSKSDLVKQFYSKNLRIILYFSIFLFSFSHLANYHLTLRIALLSPILFLPQAISGVIYSYARLRMGFVWGIVLHSLANLVFNLHLLFQR